MIYRNEKETNKEEDEELEQILQKGREDKEKQKNEKNEKDEKEKEPSIFDSLTDLDFDDPFSPKKKEKKEKHNLFDRKRDGQLSLEQYAGVQCYNSLPVDFQYRQCFSADRLANSMDGPLEEGHCYHYITYGDVDAISFIYLMIKNFGPIEHLLCSTWVMNENDMYAVKKLIDEKQLLTCDFFMGKYFFNSYNAVYLCLKKIVEDAGIGKIKMFRNHAKIFACKFKNTYAVAEMSMNMNENKQLGQCCITVDKGLYDFTIKQFADLGQFFKYDYETNIKNQD